MLRATYCMTPGSTSASTRPLLREYLLAALVVGDEEERAAERPALVRRRVGVLAVDAGVLESVHRVGEAVGVGLAAGFLDRRRDDVDVVVRLAGEEGGVLLGRLLVPGQELLRRRVRLHGVQLRRRDQRRGGRA